MNGDPISAFPRRLEGKVALITGAANNIGECTAKLFVKHGARVVIADIDDKNGRLVCQEIGAEHASFVHCNVGDETDVKKAVDHAVTVYGKLDIMVNNAAVGDPKNLNITEYDMDQFDDVIRVNLKGPFLGTKHAARVMIPAKKGSIITVGSVASSIGGVASHAYTSTKHAVVGLTKNVAAELGPYGIRVNCVSPYFILTPLTKKHFNIDDTFSGAYSNLTGVPLTMQDVAEAALYLASDESKYVSGHNLAVDGGFTTINPGFGLFARSS